MTSLRSTDKCVLYRMAEFTFSSTYTFDTGFTVSFNTDASVPPLAPPVGAFSSLSPSATPPMDPLLNGLPPAYPFAPNPGYANASDGASILAPPMDLSLLLPTFAAPEMGPSPIPEANMNFDEWLASGPAMGLGPTATSTRALRVDASHPVPGLLMMPEDNSIMEGMAPRGPPRRSPLRTPSPPLPPETDSLPYTYPNYFTLPFQCQFPLPFTVQFPLSFTLQLTFSFTHRLRISCTSARYGHPQPFMGCAKSY